MSSTPEAIRTQILALVKEYHTVKFAPKTFDPDKDLVHYAGRVFDAEEIVNLVNASLDFYLTANAHEPGQGRSGPGGAAARQGGLPCPAGSPVCG